MISVRGSQTRPSATCSIESKQTLNTRKTPQMRVFLILPRVLETPPICNLHFAFSKPLRLEPYY